MITRDKDLYFAWKTKLLELKHEGASEGFLRVLNAAFLDPSEFEKEFAYKNINPNLCIDEPIQKPWPMCGYRKKPLAAYLIRIGFFEDEYLVTLLQILLKYGLKIDSFEDDSRTKRLLALAAENGKLNTLEFLLTHGAKVNHNDYYPVLHMAIRGYASSASSAKNNHLIVIQTLVEKYQADVNLSNPYTPLMVAASLNVPEIIDYLLAKNANVLITTYPSRTEAKTAISVAFECWATQAISKTSKQILDKLIFTGLEALKRQIPDPTQQEVSEFIEKIAGKFNFQNAKGNKITEKELISYLEESANPFFNLGSQKIKQDQGTVFNFFAPKSKAEEEKHDNQIPQISNKM